jgi:hypothetical protein
MRALILILFFSSCSASWHLQRALIKDPSLFRPRNWVIDTVLMTDSFHSVDTFTLNEVDTFITDTGKVRLTIYRNRNFFKTDIKVKQDTIRLTKTIEMPPQIIYKKGDLGLNLKLLILGIVIGLFLRLLWKRNS